MAWVYVISSIFDPVKVATQTIRTQAVYVMQTVFLFVSSFTLTPFVSSSNHHFSPLRTPCKNPPVKGLNCRAMRDLCLCLIWFHDSKEWPLQGGPVPGDLCFAFKVYTSTYHHWSLAVQKMCPKTAFPNWTTLLSRLDYCWLACFWLVSVAWLVCLLWLISVAYLVVWFFFFCGMVSVAWLVLSMKKKEG